MKKAGNRRGGQGEAQVSGVGAKGKWSWNSGKHPLSNRCSEYIDRLRKIYDLNLPNYKDPGVSGPPPHESRLHVQDPSSFCHQFFTCCTGPTRTWRARMHVRI